MKNTSGMNVLQCAKELISEPTNVILGERLRRVFKNSTEIRLKKSSADVHILPIASLRVGKDIFDRKNVFVALKVAEKLNFSKDPFSVFEVIKANLHLLNGHCAALFGVKGTTDTTISAT